MKTCQLPIVITGTLAVLNLLSATPRSHGGIAPAAVFNSHMVLQQNSHCPFWGTALPDERIKIQAEWADHFVEVVADRHGRWQTHLVTPEAGGPYTITLEGNDRVVFEDVLIGEVWVCSGQSNMEWTLNYLGQQIGRAHV